MLHDRRLARRREDDLRAALITATLCNINRDTKARPRPFQIEEFVLHTVAGANDGQPETQPVEDMKYNLMLFTEAHYLQKYGVGYEEFQRGNHGDK